MEMRSTYNLVNVCADNAQDLHKMVDIHMLIIMYVIFMISYHIRCACSVAKAHTAVILSSTESATVESTKCKLHSALCTLHEDFCCVI